MKTSKKKVIKPEYVKARIGCIAIADLEAAPYNARVITDAALKGLTTSMERFGVIAPPVVNERPDGTFRIIGGHQRIHALQARGVTDLDCVIVKLDDEHERRANFALNNAAIEGQFIPELTQALIETLTAALGSQAADVMEDLRFDLMLKEILRGVTAEAGVDDQVEPGRTIDDEDLGLGKTKADSKAGLFYQLGEHRLYCGKLAETGTLDGFGTDHADMAFSRLASSEPFADEFLNVHVGHLIKNTNGAIYIATNLARLAQVQRVFEALGGHWSNTLIGYEPESQGRAKEAYRDITIPLLYGWREGSMRLFFGDRAQSNTWHLKNAPPRDDVPVDAVVRHVLNSTKKGSTILDVRAGKGTTVIAAEKTKRRLLGYVPTPREMDRVRHRWVRFVYGPKALAWPAKAPPFAPQ